MDRRKESADRRESRPDVEGTHQAALLIDFDNVTMGIRSNLGQELRTLMNSDVIRGKVAVQRAYADWRRYPQYIVPLSEASIDLIFAPAYGSSKKNATDIRLAIDALELVFVRPEIRTFILMSGDSDFSSLVLKLKEYGKYVIGVGIQESSSDLLVQNCDEYYSYSALTGLSKTGDQPAEVHDPWVLVEKAVGKMVERGDTMRSDRLKQVMIEIDPSFNEKEQGFNKFNRFVVEAASRGLVSIQKMENGQYGVAPAKQQAGEKVEKPERKEAKPREGRSRRRGERRPAERATAQTGGDEEQTRRARPKLTMRSGLGLLKRSLDKLLDGDTTSVRDSDVKRKMLELDPAFDEGELGFSKFSKFLQAAEDEGAIQLTRGPQGNFHVAIPKGKGRRKPAPAKPDEEGVSEKSQAEGTVQRLARFLFGERRVREEEGGLPTEEEKPVKDTLAEADRAKDAAVGASAAPDTARPQAKRETRGGRGPEQKRSAGPAGESRSAERSRRAESQERDERRRSRGESRGGRGGARGRRGPSRQRDEGRQREERRGPSDSERSERREVAVEPPAETEPTRGTDVKGSTEADAASGEPRTTTRPAERETAERVTAEEPMAGEAGAPVEEDHEAVDAKSSGPKSAPLPGAPRGTIRGRWGTLGRYRPAGAPPPIFEGQKAPGAQGTAAEGAEASETAEEMEAGSLPAAAESKESVEPSREAATVESPGGEDDGPSSPASEGPNAALVEHLTAYRGVGRRTAESLVEAFGAEVLRVLDEEPDRVHEILPDHRAQRVLEERRRELSAGAE